MNTERLEQIRRVTPKLSPSVSAIYAHELLGYVDELQDQIDRYKAANERWQNLVVDLGAEVARLKNDTKALRLIRENLSIAHWESQGTEYDRGYISALNQLLGEREGE